MAEKYKERVHKEDSIEEKTDNKEKAEGKKLSKEEEIAYHQGALQALASEYNELIRMIKATEAIMKAHIERMQQLGVKFEQRKAEKSDK
jgi:hypothetical protein